MFLVHLRVHTEMASVEAGDDCYHLSKNLGGACTGITAQMYAGVKATATLAASAVASPLVATAQHARIGK